LPRQTVEDLEDAREEFDCKPVDVEASNGRWCASRRQWAWLRAPMTSERTASLLA